MYFELLADGKFLPGVITFQSIISTVGKKCPVFPALTALFSNCKYWFCVALILLIDVYSN